MSGKKGYLPGKCQGIVREIHLPDLTETLYIETCQNFSARICDQISKNRNSQIFENLISSNAGLKL